MKEKLTVLYKKYEAIILYIFFGVCATLVNMAGYALFYNILGISNLISTILAWVAAFLFAFFTNKLFVFKSKRSSARELMLEFVSFFGCRAATGVLDVAIMYLAVDMMGWNSLLWKFISNVIVTILNYVASKFFIFANRNK